MVTDDFFLAPAGFPIRVELVPFIVCMVVLEHLSNVSFDW
jgi:hypothetical protein